MVTLPKMLAEDRTRAGWSGEQAARRLGLSVRTYREIEAGERFLAGWAVMKPFPTPVPRVQVRTS